MLILFINHIWFSIPLKCEETKNISEHFQCFQVNETVGWRHMLVAITGGVHCIKTPYHDIPCQYFTISPPRLIFLSRLPPMKRPNCLQYDLIEFQCDPILSHKKKNVLSRYLLWIMIEPWILPSKNYWGIVSSRVCWFLLQICTFPFVCSELNLFSGSYAC